MMKFSMPGVSEGDYPVLGRVNEDSGDQIAEGGPEACDPAPESESDLTGSASVIAVDDPGSHECCSQQASSVPAGELDPSGRENLRRAPSGRGRRRLVRRSASAIQECLMKTTCTVITQPGPPSPAPQYGTRRCACPDCKSGRHCYERANNCGIVNG